MPNEIDGVLARQDIHTLFQPIVDGATGEAFGYEALSRGPAGSALQAPLSLFSAAAAAGRVRDLERACIHAALKSFARLEADVRLFLNVLPETLLTWGGFAEWLGRELATSGVDPHSVVLELTEHGGVPQESALAGAIAPLRKLGCDIAIDDLGAGSSGLKTWSAIRPEFVKVDRYFVAGIEEDPVRGEILRSVVDMGRATGSHVIAEGIENREQCALVLELGVDYLQGFLLGRPQDAPRAENIALSDLERTSPGISTDCAEHLAMAIPPVPASTHVAAVVETFRQNPAWRALAVVEAERPVGLVRRDELLIFLTRPLHPEVYNRKPVTTVMDAGALQIDARARLEQVSRLVTGQREPRHQEDFIITRNDAYLGLGRSVDLLRQITTQQIQVAKQANPLTGLPGNREIKAQMAQWVSRRRRFIACHLDLDHFKPFNDTYGYSHGDQVLLHVAAAASRSARPRVDFVGHIGGDDFVLLLRSEDWSLRLRSLLEELSISLLNFHSREHRHVGGMEASGRDGVSKRFPLLSVSIAAVDVDGRPGTTVESVGEGLQRAKAAAKAREGHACMLATGGRMVDLLSAPEVPKLSGADTMTLVTLARA